MNDKLAIEGGSPVRKSFLPFHRPLLGAEEEREIIDTLRSDWLTTGPKTKKFEEEFGRYVGSKFAIGVNSCTAALHLALAASGIGKGDEVITTPITFASTLNVILYQRATPVLVDVDLETLNIDADKIEEKITPKTKVIIPVHFAGQPCEMKKILRIARDYDLVVIEDAAHAVGAEYRGRKIGSIGNLTAFSFYATKNITTGEGGMLTTDSAELAEKIENLRLHGMSKDAWKRYSTEGYRHWEILDLGFKYNMSDIQASLGLHQLKKIDRFWEIRRKYVKRYDDAFSGIPQILTLSVKNGIKHAHHLYVIIIKTEDLTSSRDGIIDALQAENIGVGVHFRALHRHPYYQKILRIKRGELPVAEYASDRVLSLPLYPRMTPNEIEDVIKAMKKIIL